jgi:hypothetical protein
MHCVIEVKVAPCHHTFGGCVHHMVQTWRLETIALSVIKQIQECEYLTENLLAVAELHPMLEHLNSPQSAQVCPAV